ncbi:MAG: shikimate kinase [Candidatus Pelagibacter sp. TMED106]|nr:MAG: shikimate kinase [Candidatus Pelagibacter sp. TMED106]|tara:strand:+ start:9066 stop:9578 length:513 start_codon:yes stop_codon:yes gene_type:complete
MNLKKNLVFLGMMGSGKSSIGYLVSKKLNLKFVDIDSKIEEETGMKILNIFSEKGEKFFRNLEEKVTLKILKTNNTVISLGGGAFINDKIRKEILTNHNSFWLNWDLEILLKRIKNSKKRPLVLNSSDQEIKNLIKKRAIIYSKAKFKINCNKLTKSEIVKKIKRIYEHN